LINAGNLDVFGTSYAFELFGTLISVKGVDCSVQVLMLAHLVVSPALDSNL